MRINRELALLFLLIASPAFAQQAQPDVATLQRFLLEMERARNERANEVISARAEIARLTEELARIKTRLQELEKKGGQDAQQ